jgi:competence ComEA-like helix-hairpin-helix protein
MKILRNEAWRNWLAFAKTDAFDGTRIKSIRDTALRPGGRSAMTLFERVDDGRPHPRMQFVMPAATDPGSADPLFAASETPSDLDAAKAVVQAALDAAGPRLRLEDLDADARPEESPRYFENSVRCQRIARFFKEAKAAAQGWPIRPKGPLYAALRVMEDAAYAAKIRFDDEDTGTYHSFKNDAAFVHYIEAILDALPAEDAPGFVALPESQQASVRRQREQARAHLDALMRHKYAFHGITETDIETSLGGQLIDKTTRHVVSERPESADALKPEYELLRIDPDSGHADAGIYVYRNGQSVHREDGSTVEVKDSELRRIPVSADRLTFKRTKQNLRRNVRFDWNSNGYVDPQEIGWVDWAGHCDIKAIMEQLGVALIDQKPLLEWRSDSGTETIYNRALLVEMIASVMEFGSMYRRADNSGRLVRGVHLFGGFRNDSRPDRIQFKGARPGYGFRFPLSRRKETFTVTKLTTADGEELDLNTVFFRHSGDAEKLTIAANPRYLKTVEQDYNIIDVTGMRVEAEVQNDGIDPNTGYPTRTRGTVTLDLRQDAPAGRDRLGSWLQDPAARKLYDIFYDREKRAIVAELSLHERKEGKWVAVRKPSQDVEIALHGPLEVTLSREMKRDDPGAFQTLLGTALRTGQNICADTDQTGPVWNGVVTALEAERLGLNEENGVEHWSVHIKARFGQARMAYLMQRDAKGEPQTFVPLPPKRSSESWPDFLWQDFPDVGSKGREGEDWIVNEKMIDRGVINIRQDATVAGGIYVEDDHIKNLYEQIFAALSGHRYTIVHANKRYGFKDRATWQAAKTALAKATESLEWERPRVDVNAAGNRELEDLPAIGEVLAERIIALRDALGGFVDVEALLRVSGLGPRTLDRIRDRIRVG